ncbi:uncharacterized protein LOC108673571 [Hyalella azteca]|uniref:Uncharacterized protein LOC108673571 n=1 Tax=Hyalella azteca TaxID=294128 RepID=A0A8B7NVE8_HYAAZ|nr:uncharacterized protein LOC108673571 [Hyalella azteca]
MASYIKGIYSYVRPASSDDGSTKKDDGSKQVDTSSPDSASIGSASSEPSPAPQSGYLSKAVCGLASGIYSVGSGSVGAGVSGAKWIAGTTYSVSSGVVNGAGSVIGAVASGASSVVSKATTAKSKEHRD